jgi:hypothetical protein
MRWDATREGATKGTWEITSYFPEQLELMKKYSRNYIPKSADIDLWQVQSGKATHEAIIATRSCSCRKWQMSGLPFNHVVSTIYKAQMHPEDFVSPFFEKRNVPQEL